MNRLIYAASEHNADMLYATRFLAPDAFLYFEKEGQSYIALNSLEYDRGRKQARVDFVLNQTELIEEMRRQKRSPRAAQDWIFEALRRHRVKQVTVSSSFSLGLAQGLQKCGLKIKIAEEGLFPERGTKNSRELLMIRKSLKVTAELLEAAIQMIRSARPNSKGILMRGNQPLTSEQVQALIRMEAARRGFEASHPIVAGGIQACDPHERGHGKLKANQLIILDIFPRDLDSGYWGDMTRTVVKGRANEAQRRLFETVRQAQKLAISKFHDGVNGQKVHEAVEGFFKNKNYITNNSGGRYRGFFHGTGHGLGLEIHEAPRVSSVSQRLKTGNVVTIEPGLYYPEIGGVRIEDVAVIQKHGCKQLSYFPIQLEI